MKFTSEEITFCWIRIEVYLLLSQTRSFLKQDFGLCLIPRLAWIMADFRGMHNDFYNCVLDDGELKFSAF